MELDITEAFPAFAPYSGGRHDDRSRLTISTINNTIPALRDLLRSTSAKIPAIQEIENFCRSDTERFSADLLKFYLDRYGSDKSTFHDYHYLYGHILTNRTEIRGILEIGLGTNNESIVSNMGVSGKPGASIRAFRDYCDHATVFGADLDRDILFQDERIETFFVDQTDPSSLDQLSSSTPDDLDLVIDDGLHSPDANINTVRFGLTKLRIGGWMVVEDIAPAAVPLWECVSALLPDRYERHLIQARGGMVFAIERLQ